MLRLGQARGPSASATYLGRVLRLAQTRGPSAAATWPIILNIYTNLLKIFLKMVMHKIDRRGGVQKSYTWKLPSSGVVICGFSTKGYCCESVMALFNWKASPKVLFKRNLNAYPKLTSWRSYCKLPHSDVVLSFGSESRTKLNLFRTIQDYIFNGGQHPVLPGHLSKCVILNVTSHGRSFECSWYKKPLPTEYIRHAPSCKLDFEVLTVFYM